MTLAGYKIEINIPVDQKQHKGNAVSKVQADEWPEPATLPEAAAASGLPETCQKLKKQFTCCVGL